MQNIRKGAISRDQKRYKEIKMDAEETIESKKRGEQIKKEIRKMIADYQKTPLYSSMLKIKKIIGELATIQFFSKWMQKKQLIFLTA